MFTSAKIGSGVFVARIWRESDGGWRFDGPVSYGPKHVRESGRGPFWIGPITRQFAACLVSLARRRGVPVEVQYAAA